MADEVINVEGGLASLISNNLPKTGGVVDTNPPVINDPTKVAQEKAEAEKKAAEEKAKAEAEAAKAKGQQTPQEDQLSDEQIQTKLDELAKKDENQLTDDEKKFIQKYTDEPIDDIGTARQALEAKYNVKIEGTFDNSPEGLVALTEAAARVRSEQKIIAMLENVPYMKEFYEHVVVEKRSLDTFLEKNKQPDFKGIKIEQTSDSNDENKNNAIISNQKKIIAMDLQNKGVDQDAIDNLIQLYEDKGNLYDKAKESYNGLEKKHKEVVDAKLKAEELRIKQAEDAAKEEYNKVTQILDSNNFGGVSIPAEDLKGFKEAILKPVDEDGNTILDYKRHKMTLEQRLLLDYMVYKDLKNIGLAQAQASNRKFSFKKAAVDNNNRGGGRTRGAGETTIEPFKMPNFDFTKIQVEHQTI